MDIRVTSQIKALILVINSKKLKKLSRRRTILSQLPKTTEQYYPRLLLLYFPIVMSKPNKIRSLVQ